MEYTINQDGNKRAEQLNIPESYSVFYQTGREEPIDIGDFNTRPEAEKAMNDSEFPNKHIWIWDNRTNN